MSPRRIRSLAALRERREANRREGERRRERARNPDRRCSRCPALLPVGRLRNLCALCTKQEDFRRYARSRPCSGHCGEWLPAGYCDNRCLACQRAYRQRQRERLKLCSLCRALVRPGWTSYLCPDCHSMDSAERRRRLRLAAGKPVKPVVQWPE